MARESTILLVSAPSTCLRACGSLSNAFIWRSVFRPDNVDNKNVCMQQTVTLKIGSWHGCSRDVQKHCTASVPAAKKTKCKIVNYSSTALQRKSRSLENNKCAG
uniref:Secreted protein n=1 Tax=Romanomermis culicivorax TaxID=13658 RepID=A0A915HP39_ROMCU